MNLSDLLQQKLAEQRFDNARHTVTASDPATGRTAAVTADCADRVGCSVWEMQVTRPAASAADLKARAERLAGQATGLMEPLRLVEVDAGRDTALLRSAAPQRRGDDLFYYEVELRSDAARVRRYQGSTTGAARQQVAFPVTHEALGKLAGDLADV